MLKGGLLVPFVPAIGVKAATIIVNRKAVPAAGSNLSTFVLGCTAAQMDTNATFDTLLKWIPLVADTTGTATRLALNIRNQTASEDFKLALYDNSGNLLSGCTAAITGNATGWFYGTLSTPQSVTNGTTYKLAYMASGNFNSVGYYSGSSITEHYNYNSPPTYAAFPGSALPADDGTNANHGTAVGFGGPSDIP